METTALKRRDALLHFSLVLHQPEQSLGLEWEENKLKPFRTASKLLLVAHIVILNLISTTNVEMPF